MWRLEQSGPVFRSFMLLAVELDRPVDPGALGERFESISLRIPRLRERVSVGSLPMVPPRWEPDPDFDVAHHLRRLSVPPGAADRALMRTAEATALHPLDRSRPPWQAVLVDGLPGGRQGLVLKVHHSYTDGLGGVKLVLELFDWQPDDQVDPGSAPERSAAAPGRSIWDEIAVEAKRTGALVGRLAPWFAAAVRDSVVDPEGRAKSLIDMVAAAAGQIRQASGAGSSLLIGRSPAAHLDSVDLPLADLWGAARTAGATINDAFLSGLLGGLARYHRKHGADVSSLRLAIPVSTRSPASQSEMHNQLRGILLRGPLAVADPVERIRLVHEIVREARNQPHLDLLEPMTMLGVRVPGTAQALARMARAVEVAASNVQGPPVDLYLAGARAERMVPFGPRSGAALNVTLMSYRDTAHVGVNIDPAAAPDSGLLLDCLNAGFDEVLG